MKKRILDMMKIIRNNFYMLREVCQADVAYVGFTIFVRMISGIRTSFLYVYLLGFVLNCVEDKKEICFILVFLMMGALFLAFAFLLEAYYSQLFMPVHREQIVKKLQMKVFDKLSSADMENYDSADMYTTVVMANEEVATRPLVVTDNMFRGFESVVTTIVVIIGTIPANWYVFAICLVSFAVGILITNVQSQKIVQYDECMKIKDKKLSLLCRLLYLPEYFKENRLSNIHNIFLKDYKTTVGDKEKIIEYSGKKIARLSFLQKVFCNAFCVDFLIPLCLSIGVLLLGKMSISEFVIAINATAQIQLRLEDLTDIISEFLNCGRFVERLRNVEKIQSGIERTTGCTPVEYMKELSVNNVTFNYPDGTMGVSEIDFTIHKGSKVAIVGSNGSGKSTLIKLLLRFYDPSSGQVLQNGIDIKEMDISSYRSQFSVAFQDFNIYSTTIKNNICMDDEIDEDRLRYALNKAGLSHDVENVEAQLTREFDENGILFSGGILQRIALARVLYENSDVVIMDEPTAAMDVFFERQFYDIVFENLKYKTVIFVSHRLSSVTACDKILFMEHGRIVEEGTHEYLMSLQGGYYRLFNAQFE